MKRFFDLMSRWGQKQYLLIDVIYPLIYFFTIQYVSLDSAVDNNDRILQYILILVPDRYLLIAYIRDLIVEFISVIHRYDVRPMYSTE